MTKSRALSASDEVKSGIVEQPPQTGGSFSSKKPAVQPPSAKYDKEANGGTEDEVQPKAVEQQIKTVSFTGLFRYSTKFEIFLDCIGIVAAAASGAAQPMMALFFGSLTQDFVAFAQALSRADQGIPGAASQVATDAVNFRHSAALNATYLVYTGIGIMVCTYIYMNIWVYTGEVNAKRIRERYLQAVLRQDIAFFDNVGAGEIATRIQTDTHLIQQGMSEKVGIVVNFLGAFISGFILAYVREWRLALAMTSILPLIMFFGMMMNKFVVGYKQSSLKYTAEGGSLAEEAISTIRIAQAFGTQITLSGLYDLCVAKSLNVEMKSALASGAGLGSLLFVIYSAYALAFSFGTTLIDRRDANAGQVINVFLAILIGSFSLIFLAPELQAIFTGRGAAAKVFETIDRIPDIDSANPGGLKPASVKGEIVLENVTFSYPSRPSIDVVKGLSITFRAGKTAALVGASGSGKSTIISLVERFYDPNSGSVTLDGNDVKTLNVKWLRSQIGLVSQEPTLFATSVKENVAHGLIGTKYEDAPQEQKDALIKEACIKSNADGFITQLPNGYDTFVGEHGILLSGGQKQRVAIARAIVSDPRILLLDEATSALDTQSEGIVQDALDKAAAGRTTIIIAHRLSTIIDAEVIYVMGGGQVIEHGTHSDLLRKGGDYARLVQAQKLREMDNATQQERAEDLQEQLAREEIPLDRKCTTHSATSDILENRRAAVEVTDNTKKEEDYSILYLFARFLPLVRNQWRNYFIGSLFAIATGMVYPAFGVVFAKGVNGFSQLEKSERRKDGDRAALWLFLIAIGSTIAMGCQNYFFGVAAANLTSRLRSLSFKAILRQDIAYFDKDANSTGALVTQLSQNPQKFDGLAGITLGTIIQALSTVISGSILGLVFIWRVGLVGIACMPFVISTGYVRLRVVMLKDQVNKKAHEGSAQLACEAAGAIRTVASLTREEDCVKVYSQSLEEQFRRSNMSAVWTNLLFSISESLMFFVIALVFWYGADLVSHRKASTFEFFIGLMSTTFGAIQVGNIFQFVPDVSSASGAGSDIVKLLDRTPDIDAESKEGKVIDSKSIRGHIRFENVRFRYPTRPGVRVLRDLSFDVEPGTYIALVGASGSGKSTIIQLIQRFYDILGGEIYLDGEKITEFNVQDYRSHMALVSQEPTLYAGTIRFNILLGAIKPHSEVTQDEIESACRDANILEFIQGLPDGFDTEVGGKGSQLSGGQKQRIAIARALLRNPKVLLLDEATSALDSNSEKIVQAALDQAAKGRTTIAIAHRLSTIQNADRIYFMKDGRVSEAGTHDQLLELRGGYYEFVQQQALSKR